ncbi:dynactin subunit 6 [Cryptosporidium felis]|nr:dynactin subunit 6 [Cryptosporidium felis]
MMKNNASAVIVCQESNIIGDVVFGDGCIIHPSAFINGGKQGIVIGKNNIIEECARIVNDTDKKLSIGNNNWFRVGCEVKNVFSIGNNNCFEVGSIINSGSIIGNNCTVSMKSILPHNIEIKDDTCLAFVDNCLVSSINSETNPFLNDQIDFLNNILRGSSMEKQIKQDQA